MCPDNEVLSAYFDNELDMLWRDKVDIHLSGCEECRKKLNSFGFIRNGLSTYKIPDIEEGKIRVWQGIQRSRDRIRFQGFWKRRFVIPAPVGISIIALFILVSGSFFILRPSGNSTAVAEESIDSIEKSLIPGSTAETFKELIDFFDSQDVSIEVRIQIPEGSGQIYVGTPRLLRAADYKRGKN